MNTRAGTMVAKAGSPFDAGRPTTAQQLALLPDDAHRHQLVEGELVRHPPPGFEHGRVAARLAQLLDTHAWKTGAGYVVSESGFLIERNPDTVLAPDLAYIARQRIPPGLREALPWPALAPDLVVEVKSPSDSQTALLEKAGRWLSAGARLVWIVDPAARTLQALEPGREPVVYRENAEVGAEPVLQGLRVGLSELWPD